MTDRNLYYMRDNHTFVKLPSGVDAAMAKLREVFGGHCGHYGLLGTHDGPMARTVVHSQTDWDEFAKNARHWLEAALGPTDADIEYDSWGKVEHD